MINSYRMKEITKNKERENYERIAIFFTDAILFLDQYS